MTAGTKNTDAIKDRVKALYFEGISMSLIAQAIWDEMRVKKTRNAVIGICHRMGLSGQRPLRPTTTKPNPGTKGKRFRSRSKAPVAELPHRGEPRLSVVEVAPAPAPPAPIAAVSLMDLENWHCRYIVARAPARFCGRPKSFNTSWCSGCAKIVFSAEGFERLTTAKPATSLRRVA